MSKLGAAMAGLGFLLGASGALAQTLEPSGFTIDGVYYYVAEGTVADWGAHVLDPPVGAVPGEAPLGFTKSVADIYYFMAEAFTQIDATSAEVLEDYYFFSTETEHWGLQTGIVAAAALSAQTTEVTAGLYAQTDLADVDPDLNSGNILAGINIFGVPGAVYGGPLEPDLLPQLLLETGMSPDYQTPSYEEWDDGFWNTGVRRWYTLPPFWTIEIIKLDRRTGLMWAADGNAAGCNWGEQTDWEAAVDWAGNLSFGGYSDWRLPNVNELQTLLLYEWSGPPYIYTTLFPNTQSGRYWTSTTRLIQTNTAYYVDFSDCVVMSEFKNFACFVRAVRGGYYIPPF